VFWGDDILVFCGYQSVGRTCCLKSSGRSEYGTVSQPRSEYGTVSQPRSEYGTVSQPRSEYGTMSQPRSEYGTVSQPGRLQPQLSSPSSLVCITTAVKQKPALTYCALMSANCLSPLHLNVLVINQFLSCTCPVLASSASKS
jgi:hypothetical protein